MALKRKKKSNRKMRTKHSLAVSNRTTFALLNDLKQNWSSLSLPIRGDRLQMLIDRGCTRRGLAYNLSCDEATIRRDIAIAKLPQIIRKKVEEGLNPDGALRWFRNVRLTEEYEQKMSNTVVKAAEVEKLENLLYEYMNRERLSLSAHRYQLLEEVWYRLAEYEARSRCLPTQFPLPTPAPVTADPRKVLARCRPRLSPAEREEVLSFEVSCEQLTQALLRLAPNNAVRDRAIRKAQERYQNFYALEVDLKTGLCRP